MAVVGVSADLVAVRVYGLRCFLEGRFGSDVYAKARWVEASLRDRKWGAGELAALEAMREELDGELAALQKPLEVSA